ncbi:MAG: ASKHA domain-containing protein [Clostridiales bacterium]|jgi:uncharacterized 2Fe-2S/4Fe-4S cluster protein (DUF4445 family)|nr:ASKHA domain-containing protein [Clostridiales bacterium]
MDEPRTLLELLASRGTYIYAPCGGGGRCGKCAVTVGTPARRVLACQTPADDFSDAIVLREPAEPPVLESADEYSEICAIDLGTTTVSASFRGRRVVTANPQRVFGADVVSRIAQAEAQPLRRLAVSAIERLTSAFGARTAVVCGNTVMTSILLGRDTSGLSQSPFTYDPALREAFVLTGAESGLPFDRVIIPPCPAPYVGSDAYIGDWGLALRVPPDTVSLYADMGTNCELLLRTPRGLYAASAPAGPAFEGGNISCGAPYVAGAVDRVSYNRFTGFAARTVGNAPPIGVCGAGATSIISVLLENGFLGRDGAPRSALWDDGRVEIAPRVYFTFKDAESLLLARAAVRTGIDALLVAAGSPEVSVFRVAGGFAEKSALPAMFDVGLFPPEFKKIAVPCGNAALSGARLFAEYFAKNRRFPSLRAVTEVPLAGSEFFAERFMARMNFAG